MNRVQLAHVLRSASRIAGDNEVLVVGSQSILGSRDEDELPAEATASIEADIAFLDDGDRAKAGEVEGGIGEFSRFHEHFGYYAEGIHIDTVTLPAGWRDRLVRPDLPGAEPSQAAFLESHDLVVSKLAAGRMKDLAASRERVGRSTMARIRTVAKEGASVALAASRGRRHPPSLEKRPTSGNQLRGVTSCNLSTNGVALARR